MLISPPSKYAQRAQNYVLMRIVCKHECADLIELLYIAIGASALANTAG